MLIGTKKPANFADFQSWKVWQFMRPLSREMTKEGCGTQVAKAKLDRLIELLFRDSEAYRLTLPLYTGRYEVIAGRAAANILHQVIAGLAGK